MNYYSSLPLCEKCSNTGFFLVRIFPYLNWILENTDQKKPRIWTLFKDWTCKEHGVSMSWHFRSIRSNIYLLPQDNSWSENCHQNIKLDFNKGYDGTLFELSSHIKHFQEHISYHNINIPLGLDKQSEFSFLNPLSTSLTKWSNTLKQLEKLPTNCLSVFDHFLRLTLKGLVVTVFVQRS